MTNLTGKLSGSMTIFNIDGGDAVSQISASLSFSNDTIAATDRDSCGWVERISGNERDLTLSIDFNRNDNKVISDCENGGKTLEAAGKNLIDILNMFSGKEAVPFQFFTNNSDGDRDEGLMVIEGVCIVPSLDLDSSFNDIETFSITAEIAQKPDIFAAPEPTP